MVISQADRDAAFIQGTLQPTEAENLVAKRPRRGPQQSAQLPRRKQLRRERIVAIKSRDLAGLQERGRRGARTKFTADTKPGGEP